MKIAYDIFSRNRLIEMKCGVAKTEMFDSMGKKMENLQYGKRIAYLDALKTFAILLVIEGHVRIL